MKVLGIETSCDETAVAIVEDGTLIHENLVASQAAIHAKFGGVYPEIASRTHVDELIPLVEQITKRHSFDLIAVTEGPGLMGSLLMGVIGAKALALGLNKPLIGVNHVEAHLYSAMMETPPLFPSLGIVISGGHTFLAKMEGISRYQMVGTTVDDAIGEAFDKVASLLGLPYPGGPEIERLARLGDRQRFPFKAGRVKKNPLDFSFSGLKTNVLYTVKGKNCNKDAPLCIDDKMRADVAASFQEAALGDIVDKALKAATSFDCKAIYCGGGVSQSQRLKTLFQKSPYPLFFPPPELCMDNGAMIAGLGYHLLMEGKASQQLSAFPRANLS